MRLKSPPASKEKGPILDFDPNHSAESRNGCNSGEGDDRQASTNAHRMEPKTAVIGMGQYLKPLWVSLPLTQYAVCRLPGGVTLILDFWRLLIEGRSGHGQIPSHRFNYHGFYHPNAERPGSINSTGGYFLHNDTRKFDKSFLGINNLEAIYMDPQQRQLREVSFECFENAGLTPQDISGTNIGCFVGNFTTDFQSIQYKDIDNLHRYSATGLSSTILANRLSYIFNLTGPSCTLDTACSSTIYALHQACLALETNECDMVLVAGANLIQSPEQHIATVKAGILSASSMCRTFDTSADGYGRAEGVSAILITRLEWVASANYPVRSVIRATAVNRLVDRLCLMQDHIVLTRPSSAGKTTGITQPSAVSQEAVIRKAYGKANLPLDETDYVEVRRVLDSKRSQRSHVFVSSALTPF